MASRKQFGVVTQSKRVVRTSVLEGYREEPKNGSGQIGKHEDVFGPVYGTEMLAPPPYVPSRLLSLLDINTYHKRACLTKAEDVSGLGFEIVPMREGDECNETEKRTLEEFFEALSAPLSATLRKFQYDFEALGFGAIELVKENNDPDGDPVELFHVPAHTLRVHRRGDRYRQMRGRIKRWFRDVDFDIPISKDSGQTTDDPSEFSTEIMWFQNYAAETDYYGTPEIIPALAAIYGDAGRSRFNAAFFDNYGVPAWAVFITGDYDEGGPANPDDPDGPTKMEVQIEEQLRQFQDEPHSIGVFYVPSFKGEGTFEGGGDVKVEFERLDTEIKDASFQVYRESNRDEVISAHAVPPYRMGIAAEGSLGGNTSVEMTKIYKHAVLRPRCEAIESVFDRYVIQGGFGFTTCRIKIKTLDTTDREADRGHVIALVNAGLMTPNEGREYLGMEKSDEPHMDEFKGSPGYMALMNPEPEKELPDHGVSEEEEDRKAAKGISENDNELEDEAEEVIENLAGPDGESYEWQTRSCKDPTCERCNSRLFHGPYLYKITTRPGGIKTSSYVRLKDAAALGFTRPGESSDY